MKYILLIYLCLHLFSCSDKSCQANQIIQQIENFKSISGSLPDNLKTLGIHETEEGPVYYKKKSDSTYIVWYGTSLGESKTYHSATQTWR